MSEPLVVARPPVLAAIPARGHVVLEASAGTGKTYTLEHLVVDLLLAARVPVERMLVVTFTEKATEELRERVRAKLRSLAVAGPGEAVVGAGGEVWLLDDAARRALHDAVARFDAATISTIHGFCQRVLTEHSFAHRRLFEQRLVDGKEAFARAFRAVVARQLGARGALREPLLAFLRGGESLEQLQELVAGAYAQRGVLTPRWDPPALRQAAAELAARCDRALLRAALDAGGVAAKSRPGFDDLLAALARGATVRDGATAGTFVDAIEASDGDLKVSGEKTTRLRALRRGLAALAAGGDAGAAAATAALDGVLALAARPLAALVGGLRVEVRAWLDEHKRSQGLYDFDDMLLHVREALHGGGGLAAALRERWDVALIDEFQDTDEVQWDIFRTLFFDAAGRRLFLIGDPKQAIYGFRNADVHTYHAAVEEVVAAGGARVPLVQNHRSTPALLDCCNRIFGEDFFTGDLVDFRPAVPGPRRLVARDARGAPLSPVVVLRLRDGDAFVRTPDAWAPLAACVAHETRELVGRATFGVAGEERLLTHADFMVLTRTRAAAVQVAEGLRRHGVPHVLHGEAGLLQTAQAEHVQRLLAGIAAPNDQAARLQAFLTPFFAVPLAALAGCRELPETHPAVARLLAWSEMAEARRYPALFRALLHESGLVRRLLATRQGERELTDYQHVLDLLLEEAHRSPAPAAELALRLRSWIAGRSAPAASETDLQRLEPVRDAVQLLTLHKAKGLQAPVVFVLGLGENRPSRHPLRVYHVGDERRVHLGKEAPGTIGDAIAEEERQESERLFYVALTRAQARLYLPHLGGTRPSPWRKVVEARLDALLPSQPPGFEVRPLACEEPAPPLVGPLGWTPDPALLVEPPSRAAELALVRRARAGRVLTSYTRIRRGSAADAGDRADDAEPVLAREPEPAADELVGGRGTGIFLHRLLEDLDPAAVREAGDRETWLATEPVRELATRLAAEEGMPPTAIAPACRLAWSALRTPIVEPGLVLRRGLAEPARRRVEMELVFPIPEAAHPRLGTAAGLDGELPFRAERGFVQGVVDLVFEHDERTYFVDWKSDRLPAYDRAAVERHVRDTYALQAQLYALGVLRLLQLGDAEDHARRFGGFLYCFLRGMGAEGQGIAFHRPSWNELRRWEDALRTRQEWGA